MSKLNLEYVYENSLNISENKSLSRFIKGFTSEEDYCRALNPKSKEENFINSKFNELLNFIIDNSKEQKYTFQNNNFKINNIYNELFLNPLYKKNVVIITSKIVTSSDKLSYCNKRSVYSKDERFIQTLETISSIKKYIPDSYIVLFDNSILDQQSLNILKSKVNIMINITDDKILNYYTDNCVYKGLAETKQMLKIYEVLLKDFDFSIINNIFKISGRYLVNENFDNSKYQTNKHIFKRNKDLPNKRYYFTSFYRLNPGLATSYFNKLYEIADNQKIFTVTENLEEVIPQILNYNFDEVETLGITQRISVWKQINNI